jgi:hypothetical protein
MFIGPAMQGRLDRGPAGIVDWVKTAQTIGLGTQTADVTGERRSGGSHAILRSFGMHGAPRDLYGQRSYHGIG